MTLRLCADVTSCDTDDGLVLLDTRRGRYWQLNATGATILRALLDGASLEGASHRLTRGWQISTDQAGDDVTALIDQLIRAGLAEHAQRTAS